MCRVLIVDDEKDFRESVVEVLRHRSHTVRECADPVEASACIKDSIFDVIISDLRMPGMSGSALLREAAEKSPSVVRIVLTAFDPLRAQDMRERSEVDCVLTKPIDLEVLAQKVEALAKAKLGGP